ncbi:MULTISPECIES: TraR/DksA family transcriptional regulator [Oerskovia]|uniref:TraR/DksA C4-type zinc finger protein n=1 Tax=Oerskovia rustica TaxID=2762237 RepID=A0ABR8RSF2_9CELL|nr:TraR/DksA C4-type zinc finger protein [Oerskovia rustica]MBD7950710.1 TraR/DksA C4-type zinc finger protein [Oerskovia rustica]
MTDTGAPAPGETSSAPAAPRERGARDAVVRARLLALRDEARARREALRGEVAGIVEASRDSNADDEHDPDGATIAFERAQVGALQRLAEQQSAEAEAALARLDAGTYGTCETCGAPVGEARLAARPTARQCIACASTGRAAR